VAHLHHFCSRLPQDQYVDNRPEFVFTEDPNTNLITAEVILPNSLDSSLRSITGLGEWRTERAAAKDAAFQAYVNLYNAGLLNDNLLPLTHTWELEEKDQWDETCEIVEIQHQHNPWVELADAWSCPDAHQTRITVQTQSSSKADDLCILLTTSLGIPQVPSLDMYWDDSTTFSLKFDAPLKVDLKCSNTKDTMRHATHILSRSTHSDFVTDDRRDFIALFTPVKDDKELAAWCTANGGRAPALDKHLIQETPKGFIRTPLIQNAPHLFHSWSIKDAESGPIREVKCIPLHRRRHFLVRSKLSTKRETETDENASSKLKTFLTEDCTVDRLPFEYARFNLFVPTILQHIEGYILADKLCSTILEDVFVTDRSHIVTAITAPTAGWVTDYQRYEFFGDTVLKFIVCHQLFCDHPSWPEGYLSTKKNRIVSNECLSKAALNAGLRNYIMTRTFKSRKWSPLLISEVHTRSDEQATTMKLLADVVEALIGAAYIDGTMTQARKCIHIFLPEISTTSPQLLSPSQPTTLLQERQKHPVVQQLEAFIGQQFQSNVLGLEALNHPSCNGDRLTKSYQRLEFLGDAVLDMLVVSHLAIAETTERFSQGEMTRIKGALVNAHFLGFLCLDFSIDEEATAIISQLGGSSFTPQTTTKKRYLWELMQHSNADIARAQRACLKRYIELRDEIKALLRDGNTYPWRQLARLNPDKFFSDIVESVIGAIFVDSYSNNGANDNLSACKEFVTRIGLLPYLERVIAGKIDVTHPKAALQMLTGTQTIEYDLSRTIVNQNFEGNDDVAVDGTQQYSCSVNVGGVVFAKATECLSQEEAVVVGALQAADNVRATRKDQSILNTTCADGVAQLSHLLSSL
jgi:dsRNA-specific ribonuclease